MRASLPPDNRLIPARFHPARRRRPARDAFLASLADHATVGARFAWPELLVMFTTRPEILGTFGVCASTHWLATATGMAILEKGGNARSEEHTSELQSLMRISYAVFCLKKKKQSITKNR